MAEEGYYELQVLDQSGWSLRSRFPSADDDPMVVMRARAEAEQVAQEPNVRGVELVREFMDTKTNEVKREQIYAWGSNRATATTSASTATSRRNILRTARGRGRPAPAARPGKRPGDTRLEPPTADDASGDAAEAAPRRRRGRPWWRHPAIMVLGSLAIAAGATTLIWVGLSKEIHSTETLDTQPVQAGLFTVLLLGALGVLFWVQRGGFSLFSSARTPPPAAMAAMPVEIAIPAAVAPAPPKPRAMAPGDAVVEVQQNRLLRFLRECLLHKDMRPAFASDGKLTDPHVVHGVHLFMLGAAEVCVTDTASGISDRSHLVKVMKALMRGIGSPEDRAEAFVGRLETFRKKPEEHTMILLGQLAMDHYLQHNEVPDGAISKALMRWSMPADD